MNRQQKWMIVALCLLPVFAGVAVLAYDAVSGGAGLLGGARVALVRVEDVIIEADSFGKLLRDYAEDGSVAAVVLRLNSPGGAVAASQEAYEEVLRFRQSGKPIIASMGNVAASGAYYIACGTDLIFASPGTLTGSIGVIMTLSRVHKLFDKIGVEFESLKTGKFKDAGSPHREMTDEERDYLQGVIQDSYEQFLEDVVESRGMAMDSLKPLAQGQVFTGRQALEVGLVDTLGGMRDAFSYTKQVAGLPEDADVFEKRQRVPAWLDMLSSKLTGARELFGGASYGGGMYYLYEGG